MKFRKSWIVVGQYGGMLFIKKGFDTQREALDFMNHTLNSKKALPKRKGPRLICHVYQLFGSYSN